MNVELRVYEIFTLKRKNGANSMNELSTQDIGVRTTTTLINSMICCLANRSHGQSIVVKKDAIMKGITDRVIGSKKVK